ncbi:MAG: hypothetical protein JXK05_13125 [Campylobacterales bacterium]|nr:hypothetical protein [Campylobacterales bacterium]
MSVISDEQLMELLQKAQCGEEFIEDALRYKRFYDGDLEAFIEKVETILYALENSDDDGMDDDDAFDDDAFEEEFDAFDEDEPLEEGEESEEDDEGER